MTRACAFIGRTQVLPSTTPNLLFVHTESLMTWIILNNQTRKRKKNAPEGEKISTRTPNIEEDK